MVLGLSVSMSEMGRVFGGPAEYWYGQARTMPYAQAAGDLLDKGLVLSILSTETVDLTMALGISLDENGLALPDPEREQLLFWASIGSDGNVELRGAVLLPATKLEKLEAALE